ncbi:hypothetical protein GJ744_003961 [Endocarpon pusillum]|uniref:Tail specific protease domain-containing protein n=1 Tax=Endocarpon pusillum TaxID=364733 RepID=A0A8H7A653_9EURO|nr:hypothetical protein GJ744_003961 [Endocarpon pusillum]
MASMKKFPVAVVSLLFTLFSLAILPPKLALVSAAITTPKAPCAEIGHLLLHENVTYVPAQLAYNCLSSVPLHVAEAKELHRSLRPYLKWQTTFPYVKDPPAGYQMPAFDFWPAFNNIGVKLSNTAYSSEWEFGIDMLRTFNNVHDSHTRYIMDVVGKAFTFRREVALVSISKDGYSLPLVYIHDDIQRWLTGDILFPSAVTTINGQAADLVLDSWMRIGPHQDPDAMYNTLFWSAPQNTIRSNKGLFGGSGLASFFYPGSQTDIVFANGTRTIYDNVADVNVDFGGVKDGESFYQKICNKRDQDNSAKPSSTASEPSVINIATSGYPLPVLRHPQNYIAGYYLNSSSYNKVAILSIPSFVSGDDEKEQTDFERIARDFIHHAKAAGMTKLIIDLRGNAGGTILHAFGLFMQLFPHLEPWGASRFRAFDTLNAIGKQVTSLADAFYNGTNTTGVYHDATGREPFNHHLLVNAQSHNFTDWSDLYGPVSVPCRDNYTHLMRYNLSSAALLAEVGIDPIGKHPATEQPFQSKDIIMLHDGDCTSTCATFSDLLQEQAGIKSVVIGGRPQYAPMQAVGGTRGMEVYDLDWIFTLMNDTWHSGTAQQQAEWKISAPDLGTVSQEPLRRLVQAEAGSLNVRDSILKGQAAGEGLPSQFLWKPADCRLFYTAEMVGDCAGGVEEGGGCGVGEEGVGRKGERCVVGGL